MFIDILNVNLYEGSFSALLLSQVPVEVRRPTLRLRAEHYVNVLLAPDMKLFGNYLYKTSNIYLEYLHSDKALTTYLVDIGLLTFLRYNFQFLLFSNDIMSAEMKPQMCS